MLPVAYYCDALAGAGKTFNCVNLAALDAHTNNVCMIVQPSLELVKETANSFKRHPRITAKLITSENSTSVGRDIADYLEKPEDNTVLIVTHAGLWNVTHWTNKNQIRVFFDEAFEPILDMSVNFANSEDQLHLFETLFDVLPTQWVDQYKIIPRDLQLVEEIAKNQFDDAIYKVIQPMCQKLISQHWDLYIEKESYHKFIDKDYADRRSRLTIVAAFDPAIFTDFREITFLGAMVQDTLMYKWFEEHFTFKPHKKLMKLMRYNKHSDKNVTINYLYKRDLWSKHFYNTEINNKRIIDYAKDAILKYLDTELFVCHMNKSTSEYDNELYGTNVVKLEHIAHGLNRYQHINHYANIGAYNAKAQFTHWLKRFDGDEAFKSSRTVEHVYQGLMRTSLRNPHRDPKIENRIVVATDDIANKLGLIFPNAKIQQLPGYLPHPPKDETKVPGRPKKFKSDKDRIAAHNRRKALQVPISKEDIALHGFDPKQKYITCFADIYRSAEDELTTTDWKDWVSQLEMFSQRELKTKEENILIGPAIYKRVKGHSINFKRENILEVSDMLFFDIDDGHLEINAWNQLFPDIEKVIYSSSGYHDGSVGSYLHETPLYNIRPFRVNAALKYRVILHCDRKMTVAEYHHCVQQITNKFEDNMSALKDIAEPHEKNGFTGIDRSKLYAESIFYAPQLPLSGCPGVFQVSGKHRLSVDDLCNNSYDYGKENKIVLKTLPTVSSVPVTGLDKNTIASNKINSIINEMKPGNRFDCKQRIFGVLQHDRPDIVVVQKAIQDFSARDASDQKHTIDLNKSLKKLGY